MSRYIIKIKDKYFEYSTVVDAPVTYAMTLDEFEEYYKEEYGNQGMKDYPDRMSRVESKGTSSLMDNCMEEVVAANRCGKDFVQLTPEQIYIKYQNLDSEVEYESSNIYIKILV